MRRPAAWAARRTDDRHGIGEVIRKHAASLVGRQILKAALGIGEVKESHSSLTRSPMPKAPSRSPIPPTPTQGLSSHYRHAFPVRVHPDPNRPPNSIP
jgi:hypothetical protein